MAPETTIHDVRDIIIEARDAKSPEGREYTVINMGIIGPNDQKLFHVTLFSREGRIQVTKIGDVDSGE